MAFRFGPSGVTTNGLILNLDAGNNRSYAGTGNTWNDLTNNNYDATLSHYSTYTTPTWNSGKRGYFQFDGYGGYASGSFSTTPFSTNEGTLEAWVYHTNLSSPNSVQRYITTFSSNPNKEQFAIRTAQYIGLGSIHMYIVDSVGIGYAAYHFATAYNQLTVNKWHHIIGTWDGNTLKIYKDGIEVNSTYVGNYTMVTSPADNYFVGAAGNTEGIFGNLAQARIYNRALTQSEINKNYLQSFSRYT